MARRVINGFIDAVVEGPVEGSIDKYPLQRDFQASTRIWLIDLAKELAENYPSAQLQGFDISTAQFPPKGWLPKNVILDTLDILKPIPDSLREQFDVVHTGYLCLVVENGDPFPILDNLLALLSIHASQLDKAFQKRNLVVLANQYVPIDDEIAHPWTMTHLMASVEMGSIIERERGNAEEWWNMHRRAIAEMYHGASLRMSMVSVAGRKPEA
ncbi:predicted protein [Sclerotinia sclerotiorum 1980 UF-70]|uniref:Methyltransferase domain-containing protein n=1 Tax=Sclerotinia sclerotiorum (strain ATCC 18683 / 1980 / Ss-1) TaxID=665079 RepID=A7EP48_SCLS1|nr:predicted protein [Sclerotinia sclerotiorum 1980 UF-70]EDO04614.1 predicted protein [Sclerotinia sclerotiorum 1980 UF-70]